jgi:hypothetical protein
MTAPETLWADFVLSIAKGQTHHSHDWRELSKRFGGTLIKHVKTAESFFCFGLEQRVPFPLDRQQICAINKLVNQVSHDFQQ